MSALLGTRRDEHAHASVGSPALPLAGGGAGFTSANDKWMKWQSNPVREGVADVARRAATDRAHKQMKKIQINMTPPSPRQIALHRIEESHKLHGRVRSTERNKLHGPLQHI